MAFLKLQRCIYKGYLNINNTSVFGREIESNDTIRANSVVLEQTIKGFISEAGDTDYFSVTASGAGTLSVSFTSDGEDKFGHQVGLLNASGDILSQKFINGNNSLQAEISWWFLLCLSIIV